MSAQGKVLLVTGGSRGIGAAICRLAAEAGYRVAFSYVSNDAAANALVAELKAAASLGSPGENVDYAASKGAIDTLAIGLAKEVATEGVRVNVVRPGIIDTEIHASGGQPDRISAIRGLVPMQREGKAEEVAHADIWLLSDEASYTTGSILNVSVGR